MDYGCDSYACLVFIHLYRHRADHVPLSTNVDVIFPVFYTVSGGSDALLVKHDEVKSQRGSSVTDCQSLDVGI